MPNKKSLKVIAGDNTWCEKYNFNDMHLYLSPNFCLLSQEDELRRTLLKGINAMNLDALSIFRSAATTDCMKAAPCGLESPSVKHDIGPRIPGQHFDR